MRGTRGEPGSGKVGARGVVVVTAEGALARRSHSGARGDQGIGRSTPRPRSGTVKVAGAGRCVV
eukprot:8361578-Lingulodinium_polyedra.AAC.2